jgi:DNA-directed RNA polymerase subunit K/omega
MSSNRDIWVNRCRKHITSRFSLAQAAVLRWEQLLRGARPRIHTDNPKWMETPLREIADDVVQLDPEEFAVKLAGTPYEPPRPEAGDDLDQLLGGVLEDEDAADDDAPLDAEAASKDEEGAEGSGDSDEEGESEGDGDSTKSETQAGDAA